MTFLQHALEYQNVAPACVQKIRVPEKIRVSKWIRLR